MQKYDFKAIEKKWQDKWEASDYSVAKDDSTKQKHFVLDMFPYPSGAGLHMGHMENYTATDIHSRFMRMKGYNVLHPMGWDAFGLPAENYAIKTGIHPQFQTPENIGIFTRQIKSLGFAYDWAREIDTSSPEYYRWTQWFFLFLYKNGLAYKKKAKVNWCNSCQTVLANEQAEGGTCERCKNEVIQKDLEQWFFKITDFAEELIDGLAKIDWPSSTVAAQKFWIGKSTGVEFDLPIKGSSEKIKVYTTRIDTVFGMTYVVISPESQIIENLKGKIQNWGEVEKYKKDSAKKTELERTQLAKEKTGVELKGIIAINPFNNKEVKVFIGDYVLSNYGTGAVMAVPAHDERDFDFAKKYNLEIIESIAPYVKDNPRQDRKTEKRNVVTAIIKNPKDNTYLCLNWKTTDWKSFPTGGIDNDDLVTAAKREVEEETGYKNIKFIKQIGDSVYAEFYRPHKDSNVFAHFKYLLFELENEDKVKVSEKEINQHEAIWIKENEVDIFINVWNQKIIWKRYINGDFAHTEDGILINSGEFNGLKSEEARTKMGDWIERQGIGKKKINYKLRDWLISRQRYWGAPIPIIYCDNCGEVPVPEKDLPVILPTDVDFKPTGESPLVNSKTFHEVVCPKCSKKARRESDTMDTFVCSSWYYFRFADPKNTEMFASPKAIKKWLPVDMYMGGAEHTVLHLLYARFFTKALKKYGYIDFDEPFTKLRHQGTVLAEDGHKMSKSLGNVVNPDIIVGEYGADTTRLYIMFMGALEDMKPWNSQNIIGTKRFLDKVWNLQSKVSQNAQLKDTLEVAMNRVIKKIGDDTANFSLNTAIAQMMIFTNLLEKEEKISNKYYEMLLILLSPYAPHIAEELWHILGYNTSIHLESWPVHDSSKLIDNVVKIVIQVNGKVRDEIEVDFDSNEDIVKNLAFECENVKKYIAGVEIKKVIYIKNKLLSIVV